MESNNYSKIPTGFNLPFGFKQIVGDYEFIYPVFKFLSHVNAKNY